MSFSTLSRNIPLDLATADFSTGKETRYRLSLGPQWLEGLLTENTGQQRLQPSEPGQLLSLSGTESDPSPSQRNRRGHPLRTYI